MSPDNRRQHERFSVEWEVPVQVEVWPQMQALASNVSLGGMGIVVPRHVKTGDRLVFSCNSEQLHAEVVRIGAAHGDSVEVGLRWLDASSRQIEDMLRDLSRASRVERPS